VRFALAVGLAVLSLLACGSSPSCVAEGQAVGAKVLDVLRLLA